MRWEPIEGTGFRDQWLDLDGPYQAEVGPQASRTWSWTILDANGVVVDGGCALTEDGAKQAAEEWKPQSSRELQKKRLTAMLDERLDERLDEVAPLRPGSSARKPVNHEQQLAAISDAAGKVALALESIKRDNQLLKERATLLLDGQSGPSRRELDAMMSRMDRLRRRVLEAGLGISVMSAAVEEINIGWREER